MPPLLELAHISKTYPRTGPGALGHSLVVDDVSLTLNRGETLGLVGESGSGKSTLARIALGLIQPSAGTVHFDGAPVSGASARTLRAMRRRMQPVFQDPYAALNPRMRVLDILSEPFLIHKDKQDKHDPQNQLDQQDKLDQHARSARIETGAAHPRTKTTLLAACAHLLATVGLDASALPRYPHEFSGGQRQRINIARALALRPELLVLDEPVSALDVSVGAQIVNLLRALQREYALTYLFITHSMPLVRYLATNIAVLQGGRLLELGTRAQVTESPQHPYTRALMAATPALLA